MVSMAITRVLIMNRWKTVTANITGTPLAKVELAMDRRTKRKKRFFDALDFKISNL